MKYLIMNQIDRNIWVNVFEARGCLVDKGNATLEVRIRGEDGIMRWALVGSKRDAERVNLDLSKGEWIRAKWYTLD